MVVVNASLLDLYRFSLLRHRRDELLTRKHGRRKGLLGTQGAHNGSKVALFVVVGGRCCRIVQAIGWTVGWHEIIGSGRRGVADHGGRIVDHSGRQRVRFVVGDRDLQ